MVEEHNVDPYLYADDGQLNDQLLLSDVGAAIPKLENCECCVQMVRLQTPSTKSV